MAIYYLDVDDEITSAAARIRDSSDNRIALVLSGGSRVATSRINFRLLVGEAKKRNKRLAIVAADESVRSVARSAGLPVFATVGEYEKGETARANGGAGAATSGAASTALDETAMAAGPPGSAVRVVAGSDGLAASGRRGRSGWMRPVGPRGMPLSVLAGLLAVAVLAVGLGAFFFYPSANVVLTLHEEPVGPLNLNVTVDPNASTANDQAAVVPGLNKAFPVATSGSFEATGENVVDTAATGTVTFSSENTFVSVPILAGTTVTTAGGIAFVTTATVTVPKAVFSTGTRGTADAPVVAVVKGTAGNVPAGAIVKVPADLAASLSSPARPVTNKSATTGGTHTVTPMIVQADLDKAETDLTSQLSSEFQSALTAPDAVPSGSNLLSVSARLGVMVFDPDPQTLLNQSAGSFQLNASATGTAVVAQMATVRQLAERRVRSAVKSGYSLVSGSMTTQSGTPAVQAGAVVIPVTVRASQTRVLDAAKLRAAIQGMAVDEARTYLKQYGEVDISVSPGWASTMPSFDFRIDVQLVAASPPPTVHPAPSATAESSTPAPTAPATVRESPSPTPSAATTPSPSVPVSPPPSTGSPSPSATATTSGPSPSPSAT